MKCFKQIAEQIGPPRMTSPSPRLLSRLENRESYVRILFVEYCSTFSTIIPNILNTKLNHLQVPPVAPWTSGHTDRSTLVLSPHTAPWCACNFPTGSIKYTLLLLLLLSYWVIPPPDPHKTGMLNTMSRLSLLWFHFGCKTTSRLSHRLFIERCCNSLKNMRICGKHSDFDFFSSCISAVVATPVVQENTAVPTCRLAASINKRLR